MLNAFNSESVIADPDIPLTVFTKNIETILAKRIKKRQPTTPNDFCFVSRVIDYWSDVEDIEKLNCLEGPSQSWYSTSATKVSDPS